FNNTDIKTTLHTSRTAATIICLVSTHGYRETIAENDSTTKHTSIGTIGGCETPVVNDTSRERAKDQRRVDDECCVAIEFFDIETNHITFQYVFSPDLIFTSFTKLIGIWSQLFQFTDRSSDDEFFISD